MTTVPDTLIDLLAVDFLRARGELESARLMVELKDTTAHRAAVRHCEDALDAVLDMFLLVGAAEGLRRPASQTPALAREPVPAAT